MPTIHLTGLRGDHPLGALAAFGLLRCCQEMEGFQGARLGWRHETAWTAALWTTRSVSAETLVAALSERQKRRADSPELNWSTDLKTDVAKFRVAIAGAEEGLAAGQRTYADFLTAFASELGVNEDGTLKPTPFLMTSGQQKFLKEAATLCRSVAKGVRVNRRRKSSEEMFKEALFGPWKYEDPQHSLGWDPTTERLHALRARRPSEEGSAGIAAAVWLAFEALPLFPSSLSGGKMGTPGFHTTSGPGGRAAYFSWPLWKDPLSLDSVRSLLSLAELAADEPPRRELLARGIVATFRAERYKVKTQGAYYIFRPACPGM